MNSKVNSDTDRARGLNAWNVQLMISCLCVI